MGSQKCNIEENIVNVRAFAAHDVQLLVFI